MLNEQALDVCGHRQVNDMAAFDQNKIPELIVTNNRPFDLPALAWLGDTSDYFVAGLAGEDLILTNDTAREDGSADAARLH